MLASAAITRLQQTELKQLKVKDDNTAILGFLNEAVLELHKRFNLWQDACTITHATDTYSYLLDGTDPNVDIDLSDKQLILITEAFDYEGEEMSLNDEDDPYGAATPKYNLVEFPPDGLAVGEIFGINFRAAPPDMTTVSDTIDLTPVLFSAMYFYVGFRAHVGQKGMENLENDTHYKRYLGECNRVEKLGLIVADSLVPHKFAGLNYPWP